jgi:hypothetical protein
VVRQRLRLSAISPRLVQVYREGGLNMDQLMAFAISEDHARQEQVFDTLSYNRDASRGGVIVAISHDGSARIKRGFIRREDEAPEPEEADDDDNDGVRVTEDGEIIEDDDPDEGDGTVPDPEDEEPEDDDKPISDALVRDLTAHCTLGLRLALGERPDIALIAVAHPLVAQTFYRGGGGEAHCLEIRPASTGFAGHADGIEDTAATKALADRHAGWAGDLPRDMGVALGPHRRAGPCQRHGTVRPLRLAHRQRCASALGAQAPSAGDGGQSEATALALEMTPIGSPPRAAILDASPRPISSPRCARLLATRRRIAWRARRSWKWRTPPSSSLRESDGSRR